MAILAIANPVYQPAMRVISNITNAVKAVVTTTFAHQYIDGTIVRLHIPTGYGIVQANNLYGAITVTGDTTFIVDINTLNFDSYTTPSSFPLNYNYAVVVPIGEINSTLAAAVANVLPYSA